MRQAVSTDSAPAALGPYSQAIVANGFVFCSGTAGIDPATGAVADGIEAQAEQALRNLDAILAAAGASLATLVKTTIFYQNVADFAAINAVLCPLHARAASGPVRARQRQPATWPAHLHRRNRGPAGGLALRHCASTRTQPMLHRRTGQAGRRGRAVATTVSTINEAGLTVPQGAFAMW